MRRFSQRNPLVTLNDINITPLLDLAFVLLIIFVIATPLIENSIRLNLPEQMGRPPQPLERSDIRMVEIAPTGVYFLDGRQMGLNELEQELASDHRNNDKMVVYIRADQDGAFKHVAAVLDRCERNGITQISLRTDPGEN